MDVGRSSLAIDSAAYPYRGAVALVMFAVMFVIGACVFRDYGYATDDGAQHFKSLVAAKRISAAFGSVPDQLRKLPDIDRYDEKYYGTAIQMVPTFVEIAFGLDASREILLVRHFWTFLVYFASLVCFYLLCRRLFPSRLYALVGTLMVFLYPRFFAQSFYNIKDIVFCALLMMAIYACVVFLQEGRNTRHAIAAGFLTALAANSRFAALALFAGTLFLMAVEDAGPVGTGRRPLKPYLAFALAFVASFIVLTPASWSNPLAFPFQYVTHFVGFDGWNGSMLFEGQLFKKDAMPRLYVPTWYAISVPLAYIAFFLLGSFALVKEAVSDRAPGGAPRNLILCFLAALFFVPVAATILHRGLLYIEWRHLYFTFPLFVILSLAGLRFAIERAPKPIPAIALAAISLSLLSQALWIARNHPYEYAYLNVVGRPFGDRFDRDYWGLCQKQLLTWLAEHAGQAPIKVAYVAGQPGAHLIFPEDFQKRFSIVDMDSADFVVTAYQRIAGNDYHVDGFEEIHSIQVDGYKIGAVYKASAETLAARNTAGATVGEPSTHP
jgi:hypothetical protein